MFSRYPDMCLKSSELCLERFLLESLFTVEVEHSKFSEIFICGN